VQEVKLLNIKEGFYEFLDLSGLFYLHATYSSGKVIKISQNVEFEGAKFKQIVLSSLNLQGTSLFSELLSKANAVASITFVTFPIGDFNRPISCRLNYWGGLIYTHQMFSTLGSLNW